MKILEIGGYHQIGPGLIVQSRVTAPLSRDKYRKLVVKTVGRLLRAFPEHIHSIYVRGSVANGSAIDFASDLDLIVLVNGSPKNDIDSKLGKLKRELMDGHPFVTDIEFTFVGRSFLRRMRNLQFILKTQSTCVYGPNLIPGIRDFELGKEIWICAPRLLTDFQVFAWALGRERDADKIKSMCKWMMKKILRSGFEIVMLKERSYTRDLWPCYMSFVKHYPKRAREMKTVLLLAINPTSDKAAILKAIRPLRVFFSRRLRSMSRS